VDLARAPRSAAVLLVAHLDLDARSARPTETRRRRTIGSALAAAARWSSGPRTVIVELVSVSPYALVKAVAGISCIARSITGCGILPPP
jgi:hypothetical protein